ncbi:MAG TPA: glycosyltransferase [Gaiellaceae bacterium]|nr:glycosyltransferase [Gaiellaceae bacterium]
MARDSISICIPVYNGERWLGDAIESALGQTRGEFELLIVDNRSSDGSLEVAADAARRDDRVRVVENATTIGAAPNHNRCLELAQGDLVKFLHHDDLLRDDCLERMAVVLEENRSVGLVFSRREILLEDPADPAAQQWKRKHEVLHAGFGRLDEVNDGRLLLRRYLPTFGEPEFANWIGEPSAVMVRRSAVDRVGGFDERVRQSFDIELWVRLLASHDVGFVDDVLAAFRHHGNSLTADIAARRDDWLDRLWILERLTHDPAFASDQARIRRYRRRELARVLRRQLGRIARGDRNLRPLAGYLRSRL